MKLSLQLILETLTEYGAQLIETDGDFTFTGVQILTSPTDILEPDTLYVCTPKVLPKLKKQLFAWKPWAADLLAYYLAGKKKSCTAAMAKKYGVSEQVIRKYKRQFEKFVKNFFEGVSF